MFKPGEIARIKGAFKARNVTVLSGSAAGSAGRSWPVETDCGTFDETDLSPAHPSVLATAEGRSLAMEAFRVRMGVGTGADSPMADALQEKLRQDAKAMGVELATPDEPPPRELLNKVEEILAKARVDLNGHWRDGALIDEGEKILEHVLVGRGDVTKSDAEDIVRASEAGTPMDRWIQMDTHIGLMLRTCPLCGEDDFGMETNGLVVRLVGDRCRFDEGMPPTEWELNAPSGKLVVANNLRGIFPLPEDGNFDINTRMGCRQEALAYAANGLSHAYVGNTCPGVYKCADGTFKIANPPPDEVWDGEDFVKVDPTPTFDGEKVASICTDLWWYSICDHAEFERRCKHFGCAPADFDVDIVDVQPGVYRFRHDEEARGHEGPGERVFTRFERVRDPDPVQDLLAAYEAVDVSANAYVQAQASRWPTLYGKTGERRRGKGKVVPWSDMSEEDRAFSWQRVANQTFCTIGAGLKWHEKGFPACKPDPSVPDVEPPSFRRQCQWYPFSAPYGGMFEPETLAPSFAKLCFRVLESVISFGMDVHDGERCREVRSVRERMMVAVQRYRELAKKYPAQADPEYVAWLGQEGRAEAWVASFDLGPEFTEKHREHARRQRWVPEDAYAVAFDARQLAEGHFAWHPAEPSVGGCWARKEDAQRYALKTWQDNGQPPEHNCFWSTGAGSSVPLYSVARVVKVGGISHMGETLVEIAYDYGTPWMKNASMRKALLEAKEKAGIRILSKEEYDKLLPGAVQFFEAAEAKVGKKPVPKKTAPKPAAKKAAKKSTKKPAAKRPAAKKRAKELGAQERAAKKRAKRVVAKQRAAKRRAKKRAKIAVKKM